MSLLDNVLGALGGGASQPANPLMQAAMSLLAGGGQQGGGLADIVAAFQKNGMGDVVQSWIGTGQNLPISPDQLQQALGGDTIGNLAKQLGMSQGDASAGLAGMLPQLIDSLTPQGQLPTGGLDLASIMSALGGRRG